MNVALQAAFMARPVVATRVGGLPEIVEHQRTGLKENRPVLAEAMKFLLDRIPTASQMGQQTRSRVQTMYSWERCVEAYDALYRKLIMKGHKCSDLLQSSKMSSAGGA